MAEKHRKCMYNVIRNYHSLFPMALSFCILANYMCAFSSVCKESACNAGDMALIPGWERSPEEGNGSILAWRIPWTEEPCRL